MLCVPTLQRDCRSLRLLTLCVHLLGVFGLSASRNDVECRLAGREVPVRGLAPGSNRSLSPRGLIARSASGSLGADVVTARRTQVRLWPDPA